MSCAFWVWLLLGRAACNELGALHSHPHGRFGRYRYFTVEVLTWLGLTTYYLLFFLHLDSRRVTLAGITQHPTEEWMVQMARNAVDAIDGPLLPIRFMLHDRDTKFCASFRSMLQSGGVHPFCSQLVVRTSMRLPNAGYAPSKLSVYRS